MECRIILVLPISISLGFPKQFAKHNVILLGGERHYESSVLPKNTIQWPRQGSNPGPHSLFDFKRIWLISSYFWAKTQITLKEKHYHTTRSSKPLHFALLSQHLLMVFALHFLLFLFQWLVVLPHPLFLGSLPLLLAASNYLKKSIWQTFRNFLWIVCNKG